MVRKHVPVALSIAGSDSIGGSGIEVDLKTFAVFGVHGTVAITSVVAQNTMGVYNVYDLPPEVVARQIEVIVGDLGVDAAKTGMLSNKGIIEAVARILGKYDFPLVVDPVIVAESGDLLLKEDAVEALAKSLLPRAYVVALNRMEAERLAGIKISGLSDAEKAAKLISKEYGVEAVIFKEGYLEGSESVDVLYYRGRTSLYRSPRVINGCYQGRGSSFSAAITANLAKGYPIEEAVYRAKRFITEAIRYGLKIGSGHCLVNPGVWLELDAEKHRVIGDLETALWIILENEDVFYDHIAEVGSNIAMSLPAQYVRSIHDVAAIDGRIRRGMRGLSAGSIMWGASRHMARLIIAAQRFDPRIRAAMNLRFSDDLIEALRRSGLSVVYIDREREPSIVGSLEGRSLPWSLEQAVSLNNGRVPDVIYDRGSKGREAMVRILGPSASYLVNLVLHALTRYFP
ncbi:MAG: bifunctional hydroxymethylpyrimidine kinase/phosphomethylpyrimidine kinase [Desulfurococcales archaeon]|nr:bifunctional hydroxymethylpyrimidine kinase/phosphomethylpyrimidine kinase [Desulfurococcales archaeon]